jgi:GTPase SAR1 family protein
MNRLKAYQDHRLELGDMIRAALHIARATGDGQMEKRARELLARLAADRFQLAVAGQFSRGKTTLMNALLGGDYLPMGALPMTSVITTVRYGSRTRATVRRRASALPAEAPLAEVAEFVAQASARRAELQVVSVEVEVPAEILRLGFEFADTPGIGSAIEINTATTRQFLPQADAVIFVTGFDSPLTKAEADFLADASRHAGKLFLVVNKRDLVSGRDAFEALEFIQRRLREDLNLGEPRVFALSAREALDAVIEGDSRRLDASGLPALHSALTEFLTTDKTRLFLRNVANRAARLVAGQRRDLRLGCLTLDGGPGPPEVLAAFGARMAELGQQQRTVASKIATRIETSLPGLLAARSPAWQANLRELLGPCADDALAAQTSHGTVRPLLEEARGRLEQAGRELVAGWLDRRAGEVHELITGIAAGEIGVLLDLASSPGVVGAEIAGLAADDDHRGPAGWSSEDVPSLVIPPPGWTVRLELPRRSRRKADAGDPEIRRHLGDALTAAISAFEASARHSIQDAARDWARRLDDQAARQAREAADRFRQFLLTMPRDEDLTALDDLAARLVGVEEVLSAGDPCRGDDATSQETASEASPQAVPARTDGCVVCERMEATLNDHLRRGQFRLATREDDQARHAVAGGFCPLHTWQYAAIASPLGISAGYAKLAATVADMLDAFGQHAAPAEDVARWVAALTPQGGSCPLCAALAERERSAITEVTSQTPDGAATATLCLRHLAPALAAAGTPEMGRPMLRALAAALRRDAEDMRAYALKREALHSGLVTDEESRAHLDTLRLLAGLPALTSPG